MGEIEFTTVLKFKKDIGLEEWRLYNWADVCNSIDPDFAIKMRTLRKEVVTMVNGLDIDIEKLEIIVGLHESFENYHPVVEKAVATPAPSVTKRRSFNSALAENDDDPFTD